MFYVRIDKNRKIPITTFIRALGLGSDAEILEYFGNDDRIVATLEKERDTRGRHKTQKKPCLPFTASSVRASRPR